MEDPSSQNLVVQIVLLFFLTFLNAFFSASEMAMVSLNRSRVEQKAEEGDRAYQRLLNVLEEPNHFLSTIQVGITLINILAGASLADTLGRMFATWMGGSETAYAVGSFLALALLTYISIVLGELYPKRIALNLKESLAVRTAPIILFLGKIVSPFVWLLSASTNLLSRLTPMEFDDADEKMTRDEIEYMLSKSEESLDAEELEMLQGVFTLDELMARELMVPRTDAFMVDIKNASEENIQAILKQNFSRIPVYEGDKDNIIGILHTKRILTEAFTAGFENLSLEKILQEPLFVPETMFVDDLLTSLRNTQNQMAILLDEYGGVAGLVTLEDLLEEIVGEIEDETDKAELEVRELADGSYIVLGAMTLNDFNEHFDVELESDDVDTIAGYYITTLGSIPAEGERLSVDLESNGYRLTLRNDKVKRGRVTKLRLHMDKIEEDLEEMTSK
ncbi:hemolysin family protein [Streptococcus danieliae]|uniref:HlyC/CorC family transporter n=1 Tax=Streptococcus danieliae TaxID=747656 RepID=A0A7Z0M7Y6_9STRE|nr:hemolysin family protein [Streptococcus danieliae]MBF0699949.1 HlyC/CorC family transporter [Streptococcus danieliae]NYS97125.1 HlyC/CorC family transporter [Streptococcus danieliae]